MPSFRMRAGLDASIVSELSAWKHDPAWMRDFRLKCLEFYHELDLPTFGPDLSGLNIDNIASYVRSSKTMVDDWKQVPAEIRQTFEDLGIPEAERKSLAGIGVQYDSELVYRNIHANAATQGIVYLGIEEALAHPNYAKLVKEHFMKLVKPSDHKFAALHGAVWSGGSFVYVPPRANAVFPLQSYFRFNAPGAGQFEHTIIIVDEGASLHFIEGCSAPKYNIVNLHAGCVELFVKKDAYLKFSIIENWSKNMYNFSTKRALVKDGGKIEWVAGAFGSHVSMTYPMAILEGDNASMEYTGVSLSGAGQSFDAGVKVLHRGKNTKSLINSKSLAKDGSRNVFRSLVRVESSATGAKSFTDCQSLMLDSQSSSETIPSFKIDCQDAEIAHEASVGQISDQALRYLRSRGLSESETRAIIVRGYASGVSKELPFEYAMEMNNLIRLEMRENM